MLLCCGKCVCEFMKAGNRHQGASTDLAARDLPGGDHTDGGCAADTEHASGLYNRNYNWHQGEPYRSAHPFRGLDAVEMGDCHPSIVRLEDQLHRIDCQDLNRESRRARLAFGESKWFVGLGNAPQKGRKPDHRGAGFDVHLDGPSERYTLARPIPRSLEICVAPRPSAANARTRSASTDGFRPL